MSITDFTAFFDCDWDRSYEKDLLSIDLMGAASFCSGVQNKKYSGQQEELFLWKRVRVLLKTKKHQF